MTWGSIVVLVIIAALVAAVIAKMIKDKKDGKPSCGGDCSSCGGACGACRNIDQETKKRRKETLITFLFQA